MKRVAPDPNFVPTTLGERIRAVRRAWGWSQDAVADAIRTDQASISGWERDRFAPNGTSLLAAAILFRTTPEALETGRGFVIPDPPTARPERDPRKLRRVGLPRIPSGGMMTVDVMDGHVRDKAFSEMIVELAQAAGTGRRIWMVVG